jgi:hypothetical protein
VRNSRSLPPLDDPIAAQRTAAARIRRTIEAPAVAPVDDRAHWCLSRRVATRQAGNHGQSRRHATQRYGS